MRSLIENYKWKQRHVAQKAKVHDSLVGRIVTGVTPHPTRDNLAKIVGVFPSKMDKAELLAAYAKDQCQGPGAELVNISVVAAGKMKPVRPAAARPRCIDRTGR